jgi:aerobic carbon-monoxide dehydrogenase small subunit
MTHSIGSTMNDQAVSVNVNGRTFRRRIEPRLLLCDFIRHEIGLTGTHVGCENGVCGACTVLLDGLATRACCTLAVQADGRRVETVESLGRAHNLGPLQRAFREMHGLQCGYCTPGMLMLMTELLRENPSPDRETIRLRLNDNICRCTGYEDIVNSVMRAVELLRAEKALP